MEGMKKTTGRWQVPPKLKRSLQTILTVSLLLLVALAIIEGAGWMPDQASALTEVHRAIYIAFLVLSGLLLYRMKKILDEAASEYQTELGESRQIEAELRKLTCAVEQSPASIIITDLSGQIEYVNSRFARVTGYHPEEMIGQNARVLKTELTPPETFSSLWQALNAGNEWRGEFANRKKDGSVYYEVAVISPVSGPDGTVSHYLAVMEDVTQSKIVQGHILRQRDLARSLAGVCNLQEALELCLSSALQPAIFDCGGIYLANPKSGGWELALSKGLEEPLLRQVQSISRDDRIHELIQAGKPIYDHFHNIHSGRSPEVASAGLRALALIPIFNQEQVIGSFSLASHTQDAVSSIDRAMAEEIARQVGNVVVRVRDQEELARSELRYRSLFEQTHDAVFLLDLEGRCLAANQRAAGMLGYTVEELGGLPAEAICMHAEEGLPLWNRLLAGERIATFECSLCKKDEGFVPVEISMELVKREDGQPLHVQCVARDIISRKLAEAALRDSEAKYRIVADNTYDWEFWQASDGFYVYVSPACQKTCGYEAVELMENPDIFLNLVYPDDLPILERHNFIVNHWLQDEVEFRLIHRDGSLRWISQTCTPVFGQEGEYLGARGSNRDITRRKQAEEGLLNANEQLTLRVQQVEHLQTELREQALHDPLTGLYNRRYLDQSLKHIYAWAKREEKPFSIIVADIDHFKTFNDTYGHQLGDRFLSKIAQTLQHGMRGMDVICRFGGEEFVMVLPGASPEAAGRRAEELRLKCAEVRIQHEKQELKATLSFGVAAYPAHSLEMEQLIRKADQAMYNSKENGRNFVTIWQDPFI